MRQTVGVVDFRGRCSVYAENSVNVNGGESFEDAGAIFYSKDTDKYSCFKVCSQARITNCKYSNSGNCTYQLTVPKLNSTSKSFDCMLANTGMHKIVSYHNIILWGYLCNQTYLS